MAAKDLRFLILLMRSRGYSFGSQPSTMDSNGLTFALGNCRSKRSVRSMF